MSAFVTGGAGCGKTTELAERIERAAQRGPVLVASPSTSSLEVLRVRISHPNATLRRLHDVAVELLGDAELIDDVRAAELFDRTAAPLLTLSWTEFIEAEWDPEVPGLRAPRRFLDAAFRLFCKLREALIAPDHFLKSALQGASGFYAKPPNLAHPDLLYYTKDSHRDSLDADAAELSRQYHREVDLAKILAKLYRAYLDDPVRKGCVTGRDAIAESTQLLRRSTEVAAALRQRYAQAFIDDAQELTLAELQFLQAVYGDALDGVTLAGDKDSSVSLFAGARPERVFSLPGERTAFCEQRRSPFAIDVACRHLTGAAGSSAISSDPGIGLTLFRASTQLEEAQFIAGHVAELLNAGASHDEVALIFRSVATVRPYRDALLERNIRAQVAGDLDVFSEPEALDALAVLWSLHDPCRHDYLLRVLSGRALALSDATLAVLCSEPDSSQMELFNETQESNAQNRSGQWSAKRDVRLAWNVLHGDRDGKLSDEARARLGAFRESRRRWLQLMRSRSLPALVRTVWEEGLAENGSGAAADYQQHTLARLFARISAFARQYPNASLAEFLEHAEARMHSAFAPHEHGERPGGVRLLSLEAARGREFAHVIVPNARAGSFPRWYVPDAFLYSPSLGMIAKENVGDARAARTAKFTYYMFRSKTRETYNNAERQAFVYALRRARVSALVTASGRATRGVGAPEFLAELQAARLPGVVDRSDRARPSRERFAG